MRYDFGNELPRTVSLLSRNAGVRAIGLRASVHRYNPEEAAFRIEAFLKNVNVRSRVMSRHLRRLHGLPVSTHFKHRHIVAVWTFRKLFASLDAALRSVSHDWCTFDAFGLALLTANCETREMRSHLHSKVCEFRSRRRYVQLPLVRLGSEADISRSAEKSQLCAKNERQRLMSFRPVAVTHQHLIKSRNSPKRIRTE
jgi:hypothetical protein